MRGNSPGFYGRKLFQTPYDDVRLLHFHEEHEDVLIHVTLDIRWVLIYSSFIYFVYKFFKKKSKILYRPRFCSKKIMVDVLVDQLSSIVPDENIVDYLVEVASSSENPEEFCDIAVPIILDLADIADSEEDAKDLYIL